MKTKVVKTVTFFEKNFLTILGGVLLIGLFYLSYYNLPRMWDDYDYALRIREMGFFKSQFNWYMTWSGRFSSFFIINCFLWVFDLFPATKIMPVVFQATFVASLVFFIKKLFNLNYKKGNLWAISSAIFIVIYSCLPSLDEFYYWTASTSMYTIGCAFVFILLGQLIDIFSSNENRRKKTIFAIITLFLLSGTSELTPFITILIIGSIAVVYTITKRKIEPILILLLGLSIVFSLFSYLAPGNQVRAELDVYPNANNLVFTLTQSAKFLSGAIMLWLKESPIFILIILYIPIGFTFMQKGGKAMNHFNINPFWSILASVAILYLTTFPFFWTTGYQVHVPRASNLILVFFVIFSLFNIQVLITYFFKNKPNYNFHLPKYAKYLAIAILIFVLKDNRNIESEKAAITDFNVYKIHHQNTNVIIKELKTCNSDTCHIDKKLSKGVEVEGLKLLYKKEIIVSD